MHAFLNGQCKNGLSIEPLCCDQNLNVVKGGEMEKGDMPLFLSFLFPKYVVVPDFRAFVLFNGHALFFALLSKAMMNPKL